MIKLSDVTTDKLLLAGLTAARETANAALPDGDPGIVDTDEEYPTLRMIAVLTSYAKQFGYHEETVAKEEADVVVKRAKIEEAKVAGAKVVEAKP